ncbi:MAG: DUF6776 family protein [Panacagrimonas sp.]
MQPRIVIRRRQPWQMALIALLSALGLIAAGFAIFRLGQFSGMHLPVEAPVEGESPEDQRRRQARELRAAREELATFKRLQTFDARSNDIDAQACRNLRESVADCESDAARLREELAFYRTIVTPEKGKGGVRVQELSLRAGDAPGLWRYELLLVRSVRNQSHARGKVEFQVEGVLAGQRKTLDVAPGTESGSVAPGFSFRYFQELEGELRLPSGLQPERLRVTLVVQADRDQKGPVVETFEWSRLTRDEARSPS